MSSALALAGAQVVIVARDPTRLSATCKSLRDAGCAVAWVSSDLSDRDELRRGASAAAAAFGEPDILVNCAGVNLRPPLASLSEEHWDLMVGVNLTAPFLLGQRFGPAMASRGWGRIINVTSQQARRAFGNSGAYGASKAGPGIPDPVAVRGLGRRRSLRQLGLPRLRADPAQRRGGCRPGAVGGAGRADAHGAERRAVGLRRRRGLPRVYC